jgi:hypothetical protein
MLKKVFILLNLLSWSGCYASGCAAPSKEQTSVVRNLYKFLPVTKGLPLDEATARHGVRSLIIRELRIPTNDDSFNFRYNIGILKQSTTSPKSLYDTVTKRMKNILYMITKGENPVTDSATQEVSKGVSFDRSVVKRKVEIPLCLVNAAQKCLSDIILPESGETQSSQG